ncbi:MAG: HEPN domain-containing protein [Moorellales bacterium]
MNQEIKQLVLYRMERAKEAIEEADLLFSQGHVRASVNRLYYACFYAASAVLLARGFSSAKHSGVRSLFHQKVVKAGLISPSAGTLYNRLFDARQKADYADLARFEAEDIAPWFDEVRSLVREIEALAMKEIAHL